ncbi:hypothetical protein [Cypionkella psychrotolerans]|uniref:hypothetical protein n=1 Tax=Cypionkella psychrotolerans TaxID=1678131 RepID=UPI00192E6390|nr:hypothetical protein [Cypionkella psychrotolerans]
MTEAQQRFPNPWSNKPMAQKLIEHLLALKGHRRRAGQWQINAERLSGDHTELAQTRVQRGCPDGWLSF